MARMAFKNLLSFKLISRSRSYAVVTATENSPQKASMLKLVTAEDSTSSNNAAGFEKKIDDEQKQVFWMRDPKTGYWIPENHFGDIDVSDLRAKLLTKS